MKTSIHIFQIYEKSVYNDITNTMLNGTGHKIFCRRQLDTKNKKAYWSYLKQNKLLNSCLYFYIISFPINCSAALLRYLNELRIVNSMNYII